MHRRLLNIASIVCLVLCVALMGMWVRSSYPSQIIFRPSPAQHSFAVASANGRISWSVGYLSKDDDTETVENYIDPPHRIDRRPIDRELLLNPRLASGPMASIGFAQNRRGLYATVTMIPYWFLVLASGSLAMMFQMKWPPQFTLRSLFIVTTFLTVMLGMVALLDRAWIGKRSGERIGGRSEQSYLSQLSFV
jgi:hypothetical protein